ncbi:hypothetical protein WMY93_005685 [Mugilogobius chulae]|uniref:NAD(P)(+)--arginine ADP-ribosyltransferase n=1 Tax=Mugilogobius chulae TaxID=88201 RepID=A0AAW0PIJ9_9GOBI
MAPLAVDDMYSGCKDQMDSKVRKEYLPVEKKKVQNNFTVAWREAEKHYNKIWNAIQKLTARRSQAERCMTVYRRVNAYFRRDVLNQQVRFGSFTSTSMGW